MLETEKVSETAYEEKRKIVINAAFFDGSTTVFANSSECITNCHNRRLICDVFVTFDKVYYLN